VRTVKDVVGRALGCALLAMLVLAPSAFASTGGWLPTGSLATSRYFPTADLLQNGKVLVAGGGNGDGKAIASAELYDPATRTWSATGSMTDARAVATTTQLPDGRVLLAGGDDGSGGPSSSVQTAELYDPGTGTWTPTGSLVTRHPGGPAAATLLPNGKVLFAGPRGPLDAGDPNDPGSSAELYDPATGTWTTTGNLAEPRALPAMTRLMDGRVLVAGGSINSGASYTATAELYDQATGTWSPTGSMATPRIFAHTTLLPSGKVLVAGGLGSNGFTAGAELYDPETGLWTPTGSLAQPRGWATQTLRPDGSVLLAGGIVPSGGLGLAPTATAELYDPVTGTWSPTGSLPAARYGHTATLLPDGDVLVSNGTASVDVPFVMAQDSELFSTAQEMAMSLVAPALGTVGSPISASSLVATAVAGHAPTGTIRFDVFGPQPAPPTSCAAGTTAPGTTVVSLGNATVSGPAGYSPPTGFTPANPGHYWWYASYTGDSGNAPLTTPCGPGMPETVVSAAPPAITKPVLNGLKIAPKAFPTAALRGKKAKKRKLGARITYTDSSTASATLTVLRKGKKVGTLKHADVAGVNKVAFSGKFKRKALKPGSYVLTVSATNSAGAGKALRVKFKVRK